MLNHGITTNSWRTQSLGGGIGEFVDEYVFPGGELMHVTEVLRRWRARGWKCGTPNACARITGKPCGIGWTGLEARRDEARVLVGEKRLRTWLIYMAGSAYAFGRGWMSIYQLLGIKTQPDGLAPYPPTREHVYAT